MDFNQLLSRMKEIDSVLETPTPGCGPSPAVSSISPAQVQPQAMQTPPPTMSVNLNAQGMSDIESMMKLFYKLNPEVTPSQPSVMPSTEFSVDTDMDTDIDMDGSAELKMLPDLSDEPDLEKYPGKDSTREQSWDNEPEEHLMGLDKIIRQGDDLHKSKKTYPPVSGGDNPIQRTEGKNSREQIRADLAKKLSESLKKK